MSSGATSRPDATASTRGTIYQLCVAVEKCYELHKGQKLIVEALGDVTIPDVSQVEVKAYSDRLTDGHENFWNALRNWMDDSSDPACYQFLVLRTTQEFGEEATIKRWNESSTCERLQILRNIHVRSAERHEKNRKANPKATCPAVLRHQSYVLDATRNRKLELVAGMICIEAGSPSLPQLHNELKRDKIRGVLEGRKNDFLNALIGFVIRPEITRNDQWEITHEQFDEKLQELTTMYCKDTKVFPLRRTALQLSSPDEPTIREDLFVEKIRDIKYHNVISRAVSDYESAVATLHEDFSHHCVDPAKTRSFEEDLLSSFSGHYRRASRHCLDVIPDSQDFYDERTSEQPAHFPGFEGTPHWFRNGFLHVSMNDAARNLKWRLEEPS